MVMGDDTPMSPKELAEFLGCSVDRAWKYFRDGEVPGAWEVGGRYFTNLDGAKEMRKLLREAGIKRRQLKPSQHNSNQLKPT